VDRGKEYYNKTFLNLLKKYKIQIYSVDSPLKSMTCERANKTFMMQFQRIYDGVKKPVIKKIVLDTVKVLNQRVSRATGLAPNQVKQKHVRNILLLSKEPVLGRQSFRVGDQVRKQREKTLFTKGYRNTHSKEIYEISKVHLTKPITYSIRKLNSDRDIHRKFYRQELQHVG
jgi:hypothetical protein